MRRNKLKSYLGWGVVVLVFVLFAPRVQAASLFVSPGNGQVSIGQSFDVEVRINSNDQGFNAAQATIQFPPSILQVKSIDSSPASSVFNFWLTGPSFSNTNGQITFLGGTTNGVVGASIQILRISFTAKSSGQANIVISDSAITASDGSGTNILTTVSNANFLVSPTTVTPGTSTSTIPTTPGTTPTPTPTTGTVVAPPVVTIPRLITRKPTIASQAPSTPELNVPLYPDQTKWYNQISNFLVQWKLPSDISGISAVINKNSKANPPARSEGLYDAKAFPPLSDGIWYAHVSLQNNMGWGATMHYKLAIDTVPPLPFTIEVMEGLTTDVPAPTLKFKTSDGLSGIGHYAIRVDNGEELSTTAEVMILPLQAPGKKKITVKAIDNAGNVRESNLDLEILPIASPTVSSLNREAFSSETNLTVSGTSLVNSVVWLSLKNADDSLITKIKATVDAQGNWGTQFGGPFKKGVYFVEAVAQDERGASSLSVKTPLFNIKAKPLLTIGGLALSQTAFFVSLIILILLAFAGGWFTYYLWRQQLNRKAVIAQRDVVNIFAMMDKDLTAITNLKISKDITKADIARVRFTLKNMRNNLTKAQRYIIENIKEISE